MCRGLELTKELEEWIEENDYAKIASISGHSGIIDVNEDLSRLDEFRKMLLLGNNPANLTASDYIQVRYDQLEEDSTVTPAILLPECTLKNEDVGNWTG